MEKIYLILIIILVISLTGCSSADSVGEYWACMDGCYDMQKICATEFDFETTYERQSICDNKCADNYMS